MLCFRGSAEVETPMAMNMEVDETGDGQAVATSLQPDCRDGAIRQFDIAGYQLITDHSRCDSEPRHALSLRLWSE